MDLSIPGYMIITGAVGVFSAQVLLIYRVAQLEKKLDNGVCADIRHIRENCIRNHRE